MESPKNIQLLYSKIDKTLENNEWSADKVKGMTAEVFSYAGKSITQEDFAKFIENTQRFNAGQSKEDYLEQHYRRYVNSELINFEKTQLAKKYPQYKSLLQEYRDGILLFEINDQKVWSYAIKDTTGLKKFYEANKNDHQWEERADARIFTSLNKKTIKKAYKLVKSGKLRNDSIVNLLNMDSQLNINFESGRFEVAQNEYLKDKDWDEGVNKPVLRDNKYVLIAVDKVLPPGPKALKEARGAYTAAYQEYLEKQWVSELKAKYTVTIDKDVLYSIKNKPSTK
jgi:peptidyl-prolyl cis-trans isomerase SurA